MKKKQVEPGQGFSDGEELRRRAELKINQGAQGEEQSPVDERRLLYELQVHQVELEIQNEELRQSRWEVEDGLERFAALYDFAPVGYFTLDMTGIVRQVNLNGASLLGVERAKLVGRSLDSFITMSDRRAFQAFLKRVIDNRAKQTCQVELVSAGGGSFWVLMEATFSVERSECRLTLNDINERVRAEEHLRAVLAEKEVLLRELYHRTKNNMQVVHSMLLLQARGMRDPADSELLVEVSSKIQGMALVHEMLYQTRDLSRIDLGLYVHNLVDMLKGQVVGLSSQVTFKLEVESVQVSIDVAIPCGLILNELISNARKHAFPDERSGEIQIRLGQEAGRRIVLTVSDNGVGFPAGFDPRQSTSLGLRTIIALVEQQLQGQVEFISNAGLTCKLHF